MNNSFGSEFANAARQAPRIFFAPLVGALCAVRNEFQRVQQGVSRNIERMTPK